MLVPNSTIWEARIQNIDALLTAGGDGRTEVYYLATVCQVALDPPLVSVSPNPEYPICAAIEKSGRFAVNFLTADQGEVIRACIALDRQEPDKIAALRLAHESGAEGTPLLLDCLQALECRVERSWDSGDHRTFIGRVIARRVRAARRGQPPHRFGGTLSPLKQFIKSVLCRSRLYGLAQTARRWFRPGLSIEDGTRRLCDVTTTWVAGRERRLAPAVPGICLVGCGWWGGVHALNLKGLGPRVRRFYASRDLERARHFARRFAGEEAFAGLEAALADKRVDAVLLALPHHLHAEATRAALAAGKHVLVEKPFALTIEEGQSLVRQADEARLCLAVAEQYRFSPLVRRARELIAGGDLGRVTLVRAGGVGLFRPAQGWKTAQSTMGGGVLLDVGVHYIDVLRSWFGEPDLVWTVNPPQVNTDQEGEDAVVAVLRFPDGPVAQLQISWAAFSAPGAPSIEVMGERGALRLWFGKPYIVQTSPLDPGHWSSRVRRRLPWRVEQLIGRFLPRARQRRHRVPGADLLGGRALLDDFVRAITIGREPGVSGVEGLRDLQVVLAGYQACRTGLPIIPNLSG